MTVHLQQQGRACLQFLDAFDGFHSRLRTAMGQQVAAEADLGELPPERRGAATRERLAGYPEYRWWALLNRWISENGTPRAVEAFEAVRAEVEPSLTVPADADLVLDPDFEPPAYWKDYEFHLTRGGWEGHEHMGFVHHRLVADHLIKPAYTRRGVDIDAQRRAVAAETARQPHRRVLDLGCATGRYTCALSQAHPDAQVWGLDPSAAALRYAAVWGAEQGLRWHLRQAVMERTGLPAGSFDLVTSYGTLHELPPAALADAFAEAHRLLEPGGEVVLSDMTPLRETDRFGAFVADWETTYRNEPFWAQTAALDLGAMLRDAGFVDVEAYGAGPGGYPWVTRGRRP
jgi:SAM-dependent methyltransferase